MAFDKSMSCVFAFVSALVVCGGLVFSDKAAADDILSCQDRILSFGSSAYEVQALCGMPDAINQRVESRTVRRPVGVLCNIPRGIRLASELSDQMHLCAWPDDLYRSTRERSQVLRKRSCLLASKLRSTSNDARIHLPQG